MSITKPKTLREMKNKEDIELVQQHAYWQGRLLGNPQAVEIATEIIEAIDHFKSQLEELREKAIEVEHIDHDTIILTNASGDTFTVTNRTPSLFDELDSFFHRDNGSVISRLTNDEDEI